MKQTLRTFVALEISESARRAAAQLIDVLSGAAADVKWVDPQNLHLTLKFLGDVGLRETARICQAVERAAADVEPFELTLAGVGAFPNVRRPRTIWIGSHGGDAENEAMTALHKQIESRLAKLGFRKDARRFQPHLTIGRVRRGGPGMDELAQLIRENAERPIGKTTVQQVVVFSSELTREGPVYQPLGRAALGG